VLEAAITAAYRSSGRFDEAHVSSAVTEPTLFGHSTLDLDLEMAGAPVRLIHVGTEGIGVEWARVLVGDPQYEGLAELLEDVADPLDRLDRL
jgi:hypothetical protein